MGYTECAYNESCFKHGGTFGSKAARWRKYCNSVFSYGSVEVHTAPYNYRICIGHSILASISSNILVRSIFSEDVDGCFIRFDSIFIDELVRHWAEPDHRR